VRALLEDGGSFRQLLLRGTVWVFATQAAQQIMSLARSITLARLLAPSDFGVMALVSVAIGALGVFAEMGISQALVQRKELSDDLLHTAWLLSAARGGLLAAAVFFGAPLAASFFHAPALVPVMRAMASVQLLNGLNSLSPALLQRTLDFRTLTVFSLGYEVAGLVAAVIAAILMRSVWAIVIGAVASALAALVLSYLLHPYRPRLRYAREAAGQMFHFGKNLTGGSIVGFLCTMGDNAYIGRLLGTDAVGIYDLAYRLGNLPANSITTVFSRVTFPAFSAIQDDMEHTRALYLRGLRYITLVAVPLCGAMMVLAPFIVGVLYGEKWMSAAPALAILCFFGLERAVDSVSSQLFLAQGRPDLGLRIAVLKLAVMVGCIVPLTARYGLVGTALAVTISAAAVQAASLPVAAHLMKLPLRVLLRPLAGPLLGTLLMAGAVMLLRSFFVWPINLVSLLSLASISAAVYALFLVATERSLLRRVRRALAS
jgi:O-antigen/teichoic acid export membrane protein